MNRKIKAIYEYVYPDTNSIYDRPPYIVNFNITDNLNRNDDTQTISHKQFSLINLHLRPTHVLNESLELRNVIDKHRSYFNKTNFENNIIIMVYNNFFYLM